MRERVKVSLIQLAPKWLQREANAARMKELAEGAAEQGSHLIVFPELANIGYITPAFPGGRPQWDDHTNATEFAVKYITASEKVPGPTTEALAQVASRYGVYIIVGLAQLHPLIPASLYNSAVIIGPEGIIGVHHKMHIPSNEKLFFYPGNTCQVFATPLGNIGIIICYDRRFPEQSRVLTLQGAEIICAITATPYLPGVLETETHRALAIVRAHENGVYFLACNRSGVEGKVRFAGRSLVAAPSGRVVASLDSDEEGSLSAELNNEEILKFRAALSLFRDRRPEMYYPLIKPLSEPYRPQPLRAVTPPGRSAEAEPIPPAPVPEAG